MNELAENKEISNLKNLIEYLHDKKVKIAFFRMPVHPEIAGSKLYIERKNLLENQFKGILWMPDCDDKNFETSDGIHLIHKSALEFTTELNRWITHITPNNSHQA